MQAKEAFGDFVMRYICFLAMGALGVSCNGEAAQKQAISATLSADGKRLLVYRDLIGAGTAQMRVGFKPLQLWDTTTGKELHSYADGLYPMAFLPDGEHAILGKR